MNEPLFSKVALHYYKRKKQYGVLKKFSVKKLSYQSNCHKLFCMIKLTATLKKFEKKGEKSGWTYVEIATATADQLKPCCKKSFRVKGKLDKHPIEQVALLPIGEGNFILPVNAVMRKAIKKGAGAVVSLQLVADESALKPSEDFLSCLADEPAALKYFNTLQPGHKNYFSKWINAVKSEDVKARRMARAIDALAKGYDFATMLRTAKNERQQLLS